MMTQLRFVFLAAFVCIVSFTQTGCSSKEESKTPKLTGDAASKYDLNAKPAVRNGGAGPAGGAAGPAGPAGKS